MARPATPTATWRWAPCRGRPFPASRQTRATAKTGGRRARAGSTGLVGASYSASSTTTLICLDPALQRPQREPCRGRHSTSTWTACVSRRLSPASASCWIADPPLQPRRSEVSRAPREALHGYASTSGVSVKPGAEGVPSDAGLPSGALGRQVWSLSRGLARDQFVDRLFDLAHAHVCRMFQVENEDLAVVRLTRFGRTGDRICDMFDSIAWHRGLDLEHGQEFRRIL